MKANVVLWFLCVSLTTLVESSSLGLPPSLVPCHRNNPNLNSCVARSANIGIKAFSKGDKERNIPALDPIIVNRVNPISGGNLNIVLKNLKIHKTGDLNFIKANIDLKKRIMESQLVGDLKIDGKYDMNGRLLILPVVGKGDIKIYLKNVKLHFLLDFDLVGKNGTDFIKVKKTSLKALSVENCHFYLSNLFGGNKALGDTTNRIINEAWMDVFNELSVPVLDDAAKIVKKTLQRLFDVASYDQILPNN